MSDIITQKLIITVVKLKNRKFFKCLGDNKSKNTRELYALELIPPKHSPGVRLDIKQKDKNDVQMYVGEVFTELKPPPEHFGEKYRSLTASWYEIGTQLKFTATSTHVPGTAYDPLPDFALRYWESLTTNPNAPSTHAFKVTELMCY